MSKTWLIVGIAGASLRDFFTNASNNELALSLLAWSVFAIAWKYIFEEGL